MPTVQRIDSVTVQPNNRRRIKYNPSRTFLANKPVKAMSAPNDSVLNKFISKALDKINPALFKYSRTSKKYFAIGETLARKAANMPE